MAKHILIDLFILKGYQRLIRDFRSHQKVPVDRWQRSSFSKVILYHSHESSFEKPWEPEYKESLLNVIIGIEIKITELQCKYKLSQNRSESDRKQLIEEFQKRGSVQLSRAMGVKL